MTIYYSNAPGGAGKTAAIQKIAIKKVRSGSNVLIVQPTKELIKQMVADLESADVPYHSIHSDNASKVTPEITRYLKSPNPEPHILLITWEAFARLSYFHRPENWHLFVDEVPQVHAHENFNAKISHKTLTDHIDTQTCGPIYSKVVIKNHTEIRTLSDKGGNDAGAKAYAPTARKLRSGNWDVYVDESRYRKLLSGKENNISIFSVLKHTIFSGFESVTIAGARFKETPLYQIWSGEGVLFQENKEITAKLRFHKHAGGENLKILYAYDCEWSKTFREKDKGKYFDLYIQAIKEAMGDQKFLWLANAGIEDNPFGADAERLPNAPHGLNRYQHDYDAFVSLSSLNPAPEHFSFLKLFALYSDEVRTATYRHVVYQSALRCSLRDPDNKQPKTIIVPDRSTAEWLKDIFEGSEVFSLKIDVGDEPLKKKRGRKQIHASVDERRNASCRSRLLRRSILIDQIIAGSDLKTDETINPTKSCDVIPFTKRNELKDLKVEPPNGMRFHGEVYGHKMATQPFMLINEHTHEQFIELLRELSKRKMKKKEDNRLISPSCFIPKEGVSTYRGQDNISFCNGIWLDFDKGNLTTKEFRSLFPRQRIIVFSTFSSTRQQPRWRAYIPTSSTMTAEEYRIITGEILHKIIDNGYKLKVIDPNNQKAKAHGLDLSKLSPSNLFYLPCIGEDEKASFFYDYKEGRSLLNVKEWMAYRATQPTKIYVYEPSTVSEEEIQSDIDIWRRDGVQAGKGDTGLFKLASSLKRKGLFGNDLAEVLKREAAFANSPDDRLRQIDRLVR